MSPTPGGCSQWVLPPPAPSRRRSPGPGPASISLSGSSQGSRTQGSSSCLIHDKKSCAVIRASAPAGTGRGQGLSGAASCAGGGAEATASETQRLRPVGARRGPGLTRAGVRRHPPLLGELLLPDEGHLLLDPGQDVGGGDQRLCSEGRGLARATLWLPWRHLCPPRPRGMSPSHGGYGASKTPGGDVGMGDCGTARGIGGRGAARGDGSPWDGPWGRVTAAQPMGMSDHGTAHGDGRVMVAQPIGMGDRGTTHADE